MNVSCQLISLMKLITENYNLVTTFLTNKISLTSTLHSLNYRSQHLVVKNIRMDGLWALVMINLFFY